MYLLDVNVWLAMAFQSHPHHSPARAWFDSLANEVCYFCRMTQQGFLRLATNPKVFPASAVTLPEAWVLYDTFFQDPRIAFLDEPSDVETLWRRNMTARQFSPHVWNDAYLAALAETTATTVVTFDKGFSQYRTAKCILLGGSFQT